MTSTKDKPIRMTGKEYYELIATTRRDVLREAAGIYCKWCNMGIPLLPHQPDEDFWHKDDKHEVICQAREINLMIAAEQGQGEGQGKE